MSSADIRNLRLRSGAAVFLASVYGATSTDAAGANNARSLQAAFVAASALGGGTVYIDRPGTYLISPTLSKNSAITDNYRLNASLVIYSNTTLAMADGVVLKAADSTNCYLIRNRYAGDSSLRDSNIAIVGGKIDGNGANAVADSRGTGYWWYDMLWFDKVDGLRIEGVEMIGVLKYIAWFTNCTRGTITDCYIHDTSSDGFHIGGGCTDLVFERNRITSHDNNYAIFSNEGGYRSTVVNQYLSAPTGTISRIVLKDSTLTNTDGIDNIRLGGGTGAAGTGNITDVLIDNCRGSTTNTSAIKTLDDFYNGLPITGATISALTIRNCRFTVGTGGFVVDLSARETKNVKIIGCQNPDNSQSLLNIGPRCIALANVTVTGNTCEKEYRGMVTLTQGVIATLDATSAGGNVTAYIVDEVVTESGSNATGRFWKETGGKVYLFVASGTFTGTASRTLTGGTSGAIRVGSNYTAQYGPFVTQGSIAGNNITLGADGRVYQNGGTVSGGFTISGNTIIGPSSNSSSAVVRVEANAPASTATVSGNTIAGVYILIDQSSGNLQTVNLSSNTLTGYGSNSSMIIHNRVATSKTYIGGDGNTYTDWNDTAGGWVTLGYSGDPSGAGYVRMNNQSLYFGGRAVVLGTPPTMNSKRGDKFFNTDGNATWTTPNPAAGSYGPVVASPGTSTYIKHGW